MRQELLGLVFGLAAGCAVATAVSAQQVATPAATSSRLAELWWTDFTIETFRAVSGGLAPVTGADCRLVSYEFEANVSSPATVRVPIYRAGRNTVTVTCTHAGQTASASKTCINSAGKPRSRFTVTVSTCIRPILSVTFTGK